MDPVIHWRSDDLATRAWRAAVFAVMLMALGFAEWGDLFSGSLYLAGIPVQCYSLWLLARLAFMEEDLGGRQTWHLYGALAGNLLGVVLILTRCLFWRYWYFF